MNCGAGTLIVHLGMSGVCGRSRNANRKNDHFDLVLANGKTVRRAIRTLRPCVVATGDVSQHALLGFAGPEPCRRIQRPRRSITHAQSQRCDQTRHHGQHWWWASAHLFSEALFRAGISSHHARRPHAALRRAG